MNSSRVVARRRRNLVFAFALLLLAIVATPVLAESESPPEQGSRRAGPEIEIDRAELTAANEEAEAEARERERAEQLELATPKSERERDESRDAYAELSGAAAESLLESSAPTLLDGLEGDLARQLSELDIQQIRGTYGALVSDGNGGSRLVESSIPIESTAGPGPAEPLDLSLERSGAYYEPRSALTPVRLPDTAGGSILLPEGVSVSDLPGAGDVTAQRFGDKDLFYPNTDASTDTLVSPVSGGVEISEQLRSADSPEQFRFELTLPQGASLRPDTHGGVEVIDASGASVALIPAPTAVDAQGTDVPVTMSIDGSTLIVDAPHRSGDFAYPILVDPEVIEHWESWNAGWNTYALGYWVWGESWAGAGYEHSTGCIVTCWGSGLYSRSRGSNFNYPAGAWGQFVYQAPGSTGFIKRAVFGPNNGSVYNCNTVHPHGYVGIYNVYTGTWPSRGEYMPLSFSNSTFDTGWAGSNGVRLAVAGISTGGVASKLTCGHDFFVGGAALFLGSPDVSVGEVSS